MESIKNRVDELVSKINIAWKKLLLDEKIEQINKLQQKIEQPDYWQTSSNSIAMEETKKLAVLVEIVKPWQELRGKLKEIQEFLVISDAQILRDLESKLNNAQTKYDQLRFDLRFNGANDSYNVIMNIQSGAGGLDAQDWAQMLQKMYIRWSEKNSMKVKILAESYGEEAGLKNVSMLFSGKYVYGKLKGEHGVHRLVRLSPFNSAKSRETSFAMVEVIPQIDQLEAVKIDEKDLRVDVYRSGGKGGQSVNTTDSAVRITHLPTGVVVSIQNERSQIQNKEMAMKVLKSRLAVLAMEQHQAKISDLKGPNQEADWGNQISSYVLHPYTMVKDNRSNFSTTDVDKILNGEINPLIEAFVDLTLGD